MREWINWYVRRCVSWFHVSVFFVCIFLFILFSLAHGYWNVLVAQVETRRKTNIWVYDARKIICDVMSSWKNISFEWTKFVHITSRILERVFHLYFGRFALLIKTRGQSQWRCNIRSCGNAQRMYVAERPPLWVVARRFFFSCRGSRITASHTHHWVREEESLVLQPKKNDWQKKNKHMYNIIMCWRRTYGWRHRTLRKDEERDREQRCLRWRRNERMPSKA